MTVIDTPEILDVRAIRLDQITEHPRNPRKTFAPGPLANLADSIRVRGVLVPVLARPTGPDTYQLVDGARRLRAAAAAGLDSIPAVVREMTEAEALEAMVIANSQREDVHPLEEADGYVLMRDETHRTPEEIAARIGKSVWHVYRRLQLASLRAPAREAFMADRISAATAQLLARIHDGDVQDAAVAQVLPLGDSAEPRTVTDCRRIVLAMHATPLRDAPFDTTDAKLVRKAGACGGCPHRAGNTPQLFDDIHDGDTCTLRSCYDKKVAAAAAKALEAAEERGLKVLRGAEGAAVFRGDDADLTARNGDLVMLDEPIDPYSFGEEQEKTWARALGDKAPEPAAVAQAPSGRVVELYSKKALAAAAKRHKIPIGRQQPAASKPRVESPEKVKAAQLEHRIDNETTDRIGAAVAAAAIEMDRRTFLYVLAGSIAYGANCGDVLRRRGFSDHRVFGMEQDLVLKHAQGLPEDELVGLLAEIAHAAEYDLASSGHEEDSTSLQRVFEIDAKAIRAQVTEELSATPGTCRKCFCTEDIACTDEPGSECSWADEAKTLCSFCAPVQPSKPAAAKKPGKRKKPSTAGKPWLRDKARAKKAAKAKAAKAKKRKA